MTLKGGLSSSLPLFNLSGVTARECSMSLSQMMKTLLRHQYWFPQKFWHSLNQQMTLTGLKYAQQTKIK